MSLLMERSFESVQELNRYRKELTKEIAKDLAAKAEGLILPGSLKPSAAA
jgi:hypothetical protein